MKCYEVAGWLAAGGARGRGEIKEDKVFEVYERDEWPKVAAHARKVLVRTVVLRMKEDSGDKEGGGWNCLT